MVADATLLIVLMAFAVLLLPKVIPKLCVGDGP